MPDAHANFAYSLVTVAPVPAASGLSLTVANGSVFPAVPFNAVVCPVGVLPLAGNAEIVRVTANAAGALTILRSQESTSARAILAGDALFAAVTAKTLTDIEGPTLSPATGEPATIVDAGTTGSAIDAITCDQTNRRVIYVRTGPLAASVRCYDVASGAKTIVATDNVNISDISAAAQPAIDGFDMIAYPTASGRVKVVTYAGATITQSAVFSGVPRWVCWQYDASFNVNRVLVSANDGVNGTGIYVVNAATGASTFLVSTSPDTPIATSGQTRNIAWFDNGALWFAQPDGTSPTMVPGAPASDTSRPAWPRYLFIAGADYIYYLTSAGDIVRIKEDGSGLLTIVDSYATGIRNPIDVITEAVVYQRSRTVPSLGSLWVSSPRGADNGDQIVPVPLNGTFVYSPALTAVASPIGLAFGFEIQPDFEDGVAVVELTA